MTDRGGNGFTLFEAVVSMALIAMLVYIGSTSFLKMAPRFELEKAVWSVRSTLNAVRYRALYEGSTFRVRFEGPAYCIERYDDDAKAWILASQTSLESVSVGSNNSPVFTPEGTVTGLATITISNSWGSYKLTLAITGRIKTTRIE